MSNTEENKLSLEERITQSNSRMQECCNNINELRAKLRVEQEKLTKEQEKLAKEEETNRQYIRELRISQWVEVQKNTNSVTELAGILADFLGFKVKHGTRFATLGRESPIHGFLPRMKVEISTGDIYFRCSKKVGGNIHTEKIEFLAQLGKGS